MPNTLRINQDAFKLFAATAYDPALFFFAGLRVKYLRRWQFGVCDEIKRKFIEGKRHISVLSRTCRGAGKTFLAAGLGLWWTATRPDARGLTTAPGWEGVEKYLWPEIAKLYNGSRLREWSFGRMLTTEFLVDQNEQGRPSWYLMGGASDKPEKLEGHHSPRATIRIIDEAKTVETGVFKSTLGMLDAPETLDLWISTPGLRTGDFYERDLEGDPEVIRSKVTIDDLIAEGIEGKREAKALMLQDLGGESGVLYRAHAMAEYIDSGEGVLYPFSWIERAMTAPRFKMGGRPTLGYDVAGSADGDENAVAPAWGPDHRRRIQIGEITAWKEADTQISKDRAMELARKFNARAVRGDVQGLGKGVCDSMRREVSEKKLSMGITDYRAADPARDPERFLNRKAEDAWALREMLEVDPKEDPDGGMIRLPNDPMLKKDMAAMKYEIRNGKIRVIDPPNSPDRFDATLLAIGSAGARWEGPRIKAEGAVFVKDLMREDERPLSWSE